MSTSSPALLALRTAALLGGAICIGAIALLFARTPACVPPSLGRRGRNRAAARNNIPVFALAEPVLIKLAGIVSQWPIHSLRDGCERLIRRAGDAGGLCADEVIALGVIGSCLGFAFSAWLLPSLDVSLAWTPGVAVVGAAMPAMRLDATARERAKAFERSLPSAMDLCVLCMGAGTDFPSALGFAARELGLGHEVCREELSVLLEQLALGRTRVEALQDLSARSGSQTVQQFVAAVSQSETKGTPLVEALTIQSATLRQRRSVLAEELAAQAGVRMMLPLMLMVSSVLLVIFGPFIVNGIGL